MTVALRVRCGVERGELTDDLARTDGDHVVADDDLGCPVEEEEGLGAALALRQRLLAGLDVDHGAGAGQAHGAPTAETEGSRWRTMGSALRRFTRPGCHRQSRDHSA